jgi:ATP-dependent Clp protease ATP-binding subunit ClpC
MDEARALAPDSKSIGTEHLLLGLLREREGIAGQVLFNFGLRVDEVRREIAKRTRPGTAD